MRTIPLTRAATLLPHARFLESIGAPIERGLEREHIPPGALDDPDCLIPTRSNWAFIGHMARDQAVEDLGVRVAMEHAAEVMSGPLAARLHQAPTLRRAINVFNDLCHRESSGMRTWLVPAGSTATYRLHKTFGPETPGFAETEWLGLAAMIHVVQIFLGPEWQPKRIALRAANALPTIAREIFPQTTISTGAEFSGFDLPAAELARGLPLSQREASSAPPLGQEPARTLAGTLRQLLPTYLQDGYLHVDLAAELVGTSSRSLQRALRASGTSYSALIEEVRGSEAIKLLAESDLTSIEIARTLGYRDASNFARAFRRVAGVSPENFRDGARYTEAS